MFTRNYPKLDQQSYMILGPRGTGKTTWLKTVFPQAQFIDLLQSHPRRILSAAPERLESLIEPRPGQPIIIDEIQKIPELLNEIHRLIETKKHHFIMTGSSARKLRQGGVNLLAGRARQRLFFPLTCWEMGSEFDLSHALQWGLLPSVYSALNPLEYLDSYVMSYLKEEVFAEGLTRNLNVFTRFLEIISFSQAQCLTMTNLASDVGANAKLIAAYVSLLEDLLLAKLLPVFTKKAKRRMAGHPKFFLFDRGVYRALRPRGPLDSTNEIDGAALETIFFQHHEALMEFNKWDQELFYWRTSQHVEVDFISYGSCGIFAFEIKRTSQLRKEDLKGLSLFKQDYPTSTCYFLYGGDQEMYQNGIFIKNFRTALLELPQFFCKRPE